MPRIDPVQLLKCLSVLLAPGGGIKSKDEVNRLASLMNKFSKKLVSKCIYIQILKRTETELLGSFMGAGGWSLVHMWLADGSRAENWPLVKELLELLLLCPVDVDRLKINSCPKLVKDLSKDPARPALQRLALELVQRWLRLVKGESAPAVAPADPSASDAGDVSRGDVSAVLSESADDGENERLRRRESGGSGSSGRSERGSGGGRPSSSGDRRRSGSKTSKERRSSSGSGESDRSKRSRRGDGRSGESSERGRGSSEKSRGSSDKGGGSSERNGDRSEPQPKGEAAPPSIAKLGKIPKRAGGERSEEVKRERPSLSVEVRRSVDQNRPKTVKTFNSKFRSHGLEEEARPPPPRGSVKRPAVSPAPVPAPAVSQRRASPARSAEAPPEKRPKGPEPAERPGAAKLIPPKPKPAYLLESGSFMDALAASATNKKEPKKRKRHKSPPPPSSSPSPSPSPATATLAPPVPDPKSAPLRFYQDTLRDDDDRDDDRGTEATPESPPTSADVDAAPRGVLSAHSRPGPKKTLRWRDDAELEEVRYFELDETERVNVTKTFLDMKQMEHHNEREAFKKSRNFTSGGEDLMEERTPWRRPPPVDDDGSVLRDPGRNSKERHVQMCRQAQILQAIYFHKSMIPDSPAEPDHEPRPNDDPPPIPLEDVAGNPESVNDFQNTPWPEPKLSAPTRPLPHPHSHPHPHQAPLPPPHPAHQLHLQPPHYQQQQQQPPPPPQMHPFNGGPRFEPFSPYPGDSGPAPDYPYRQPDYEPQPFRGGGGGFARFPKARGGPRGPWRAKGAGGWGGPHRGGGGGGGGHRRPCTHFQKRGYCREGDSCPFAHYHH